jgi:DNA-binding response OmpR family regulator
MDTKKRILIIDDTKNYLWLLSQSFVENGFAVTTAGNGEEGLSAIEKEKPDLILLDIEMPIMDGITMAKKLKESGIDVPIIFLTNMSDVKHISEAAETAADYIVKSDLTLEGVVARVKEKLNIQ